MGPPCISYMSSIYLYSHIRRTESWVVELGLRILVMPFHRLEIGLALSARSMRISNLHINLSHSQNPNPLIHVFQDDIASPKLIVDAIAWKLERVDVLNSP